MKIIFDRSAFHDHFDLLKGSRLPQLTQENKIIVYHTAEFLEETLRLAISSRHGRKEALGRQWPFLQSICNGGWFKPLLDGQPPLLKSVCDEELDGGEKDRDWPLVRSLCRSAIEAKVNRLLEGSGSLTELENARPIYDQNEQIKTQNKALRFQLQREHTLRKGESFREYHQSLFADAAWLLIHRPRDPDQLENPLAALEHPELKFDAWKRDPAKFPHFTAFVGCLIYSHYDAERNQSSSLDPNWLPDAEQLCFLVDVDAMVSAERGFMKRAFEALWQPSEKRFFTPREFVTFLSEGSFE